MALSCGSRSGDRPVLVRGPRGETHRPLWEEAQQRGDSYQRGGEAVSGQDAGDVVHQLQGQEEPGEHPG